MNGEFKKDYEPYQTMVPLSGIFDQQTAEKLARHRAPRDLTPSLEGVRSHGSWSGWTRIC
jgi:hypothetical protein